MKRRRGRSARSSGTADPAIGRTIGIDIEEIGSNGDGVGRFDGSPVYVALALPGDALTVRISARRGAGYAADLVEARTLVTRQAPACRHFGTCGGCRLQHLPPPDYRRWKVARIRAALASRGIGNVEIRPLIDGRPATRRRLRLAFSPAGRGMAFGFRRRRRNEIVAIEECPIALSAIVALFEPLRRCLRQLDIAENGGELWMTAADNGLDLLIETPLAPGLADRETLAALAEAEDVARIAWRSHVREPAEPIAVRRQPQIDVGGIPVALPIAPFLQATREAEQAIRKSVAEAVGSSRSIADLFCGCGALGLPLAERAGHLHAVDQDATMVHALNVAARAASLGQKVDALARDLDRDPLTAAELSHFDALILDPPRAGARTQVEAIAAAPGPQNVAMVSCNPSTFARDARTLIDGGYSLTWVQPIDAFLHAAEIEMVGAFGRKITP